MFPTFMIPWPYAKDKWKKRNPTYSFWGLNSIEEIVLNKLMEITPIY